MQADFDDVRFTSSDGTTLIDYWLESKTNSVTANFWVKIPSVPASPNKTTIYLYYGNPSAGSASNGNNTFLFFDDFASSAGTSKSNLGNMTAIGLYEKSNPVIPVGNSLASDRFIREIGNVIYEPEATSRKYKTWYTGYNGGGSYNETDEKIHYAYSEDGINWTKSSLNPVVTRRSEDPYVVKNGSTYYLFAEDKEAGTDKTRRWHSSDGEKWIDDGQLSGISDVTSPVVWIEGSTWYLLYERFPTVPCDAWLATSSDGLVWTNNPANPVFESNDTSWVTGSLVVDDIVKRGLTYYLFYHGYDGNTFREGEATSTNLTTWTDNSNNPIEPNDGNNTRIPTAELFHDTEDKFLYYGDSDSTGIYLGYPTLVTTAYLDSSKWTPYQKGGNTTIQLQADGTLRLSGVQNTISSASIQSKQTFTNNIAVEMRSKADNPDYQHFSLGGGEISDYSGGTTDWWVTTQKFGYLWLWNTSTSASVRKMPSIGPGSLIGTTFAPGNGDTYRTDKFIYDSSGNLKWYIDGVLKNSATDTEFLNTAKKILITQGEYSDGNGGNRYIDWIFVRSYVSSEPTYSIGVEVTPHRVDIFDLRQLLSTFTSIFDYNLVVGNYGK